MRYDLKNTDYKVVMEQSYDAEIFGDEYDKESIAEERAKKWQYREIQGKHGTIFPYDSKGTLAVTTDIKATRSLLYRFKRVQFGDSEQTFLFPFDQLDYVAAFIGARKKRKLSEAQKAALLRRLNKN